MHWDYKPLWSHTPQWQSFWPDGRKAVRASISSLITAIDFKKAALSS